MLLFGIVCMVASISHGIFVEPLSDKSLIYAHSEERNLDYYCSFGNLSEIQKSHGYHSKCFKNNKGMNYFDDTGQKLYPYLLDGVGLDLLCPLLGHVNFEDCSRRPYKSCQVRCEPGYVHVTDSVECQLRGPLNNVSVAWTDDSPCAFVPDCPEMENVNLENCESRRPGEDCQFSCNKNFDYVTDAESLHCQLVGSGKNLSSEWSHKNPCRRIDKCPNIENVKLEDCLRNPYETCKFSCVKYFEQVTDTIECQVVGPVMNKSAQWNDTQPCWIGKEHLVQSSTLAIVGGVVGTICAICAIIILVCCVQRRLKLKRKGLQRNQQDGLLYTVNNGIPLVQFPPGGDENLCNGLGTQASLPSGTDPTVSPVADTSLQEQDSLTPLLSRPFEPVIPVGAGPDTLHETDVERSPPKQESLTPLLPGSDQQQPDIVNQEGFSDLPEDQRQRPDNETPNIFNPVNLGLQQKDLVDKELDEILKEMEKPLSCEIHYTGGPEVVGVCAAPSQHSRDVCYTETEGAVGGQNFNLHHAACQETVKKLTDQKLSYIRELTLLVEEMKERKPEWTLKNFVKDHAKEFGFFNKDHVQHFHEHHDRNCTDGAAAAFLNRLKEHGCKISRLVEYFHSVKHYEFVNALLRVHSECPICQTKKVTNGFENKA